MKKQLAVIISLAMLFSGCAVNTAPEEGESAVSEAAALPVADHTLQEIVILGSEYPTTVNATAEKISELDENLQIKLSDSMSSIVLRSWNATDLSLYKNGYISIDVMGSGSSFDVGFGEITDGITTTAVTNVAVTPTDTRTTVTVPLSELDSELLHVREFVIGNADGDIWVSSIKLISEDSEKIYPAIKVNQEGYKTASEKIAVVSGFGDVLGCNVGTEFNLVNTETGETAFTGTLALITEYDELFSGEAMLSADFSDYTEEGSYYIQIADIDESSPVFTISDNVYDSLLADSMRYFYYQRANTEITEDYGEGHSRGDVTPEDFDIDGIDVSGGWYDAGDVGKYVSPGATAVNTLLWAYKLYPDKFYDGQNNIPESGNGIPDILDEVKYELDFLLKMQDEDSGGFHMKVKSQSENDSASDRAVWECTTNSTADCSAVLAFASTVYSEFDSDYADRLLSAAEEGWAYIEENPDYYVSTTYSGENDSSATFWAAGCLYYATGNDTYGKYVEEHYSDYLIKFGSGENGHNVGNMAIYGYYTYLLSDNTDEEISALITKRYKSWRSGVRNRYEANPWQVSINSWGFWWGSFNTILGSPQDMIVGNYAIGDDLSEGEQFSADALNFIMGENPLRKSFVTGHGDDAIAQTFSNIWSAGDNFPDGYMPGGINNSEGNIISKYPMKCYTDEPFDWVTNENAIYWNAVLVFNAAVQD